MPFSTGAQRQSVVTEAQQPFGVGAIGSLMRSDNRRRSSTRAGKSSFESFLGLVGVTYFLLL